MVNFEKVVFSPAYQRVVGLYLYVIGTDGLNRLSYGGWFGGQVDDCIISPSLALFWQVVENVRNLSFTVSFYMAVCGNQPYINIRHCAHKMPDYFLGDFIPSMFTDPRAMKPIIRSRLNSSVSDVLKLPLINC